MVHRDHAFTDFRVTEPGSWIRIALFVLPLASVTITARSRSARLRAYLCVADPILAVGTAYMIWVFASLSGTPAVGAYLAIGALTIYFGASVTELWRSWRARP